MNCQEARERLLDAEAGTLRARTGALGAHLATCAACAAIADEILADHAALHDALTRLSSPAPAARRRMWPRLAPARAARRRTWPRLAALAPLAAAAMVALLLWGGREEYRPIVIPEETVPATTVVNGTGPGGVAVMQTRDPDITVIWNY